MNTKRFALFAVLSILVLALSACGVTAQSPVAAPAVAAAASVDGCTEITGSGDLTEAEANGLVFMREEEELARDVYLTLYDRWGLNVFGNIAQSEQKHMDEVTALIDAYGLENPDTDEEIGVFANPELQALYDELVAAGSVSLEAALGVGAAIEEIDILDLDAYIAETQNADLIRVYGDLRKGSTNHLRSFVAQLENRTGATYAPQYLTQDAYDAIMTAEDARGNGERGGNGGEGSQGSGQGAGNGQGQGAGRGRNQGDALNDGNGQATSQGRGRNRR